MKQIKNMYETCWCKCPHRNESICQGTAFMPNDPCPFYITVEEHNKNMIRKGGK